MYLIIKIFFNSNHSSLTAGSAPRDLMKHGSRKSSQEAERNSEASLPAAKSAVNSPVRVAEARAARGWYESEEAAEEEDEEVLDSVRVDSEVQSEGCSLGEALRVELENIRDDPDLDEEEREEQMLRVNVKYYISGILDAVCQDYDFDE